ncbi:MAG: adenylate kinase [Candidatus Hodarchaeota archaeon]
MKIVMLGPPGAGKGTQAKKITEKYNIPRISTGDILRKEIREKTEIGEKVKDYINNGKLAPDDIIIDIIKDLLKKSDYKKGYIFDGFPRTLTQARELDKMDTINAVLYINVPFDELVKRLSGRRNCPKCGKLYNLVFVPPKIKDICDSCGTALIQREDDKEEVVIKRIKTYHEQTEPLINYYKNKKLLKEIDGIGKIEDIFNKIIIILNKLN